MQLRLFSIIATIGLVAASALPRDVCTGTYRCPSETTDGIQLASEFDYSGGFTCFYQEFHIPPGGGIGPVDPSCEYDSTTGALTGSAGFSDGECPEVAECWLGTLPPKRA